MAPNAHRRRHTRFSPGRAATLSFRLGGRWFLGVPLVDLSLGGCRAQLPPGISPLARLEQLEIHHPLIPPSTFRGLVVRPEGGGGAGIAFRDVPRDVRQLLQGLAYRSLEA
jgi:hypothetical protein